METNQRKVGRPKAPPRTGPLVLGAEYGRGKVTLEISEPAERELTEYVRWVQRCSGRDADEARFTTVDFALREIFRRDRVWQAKKGAVSEPTTAVQVEKDAPSEPTKRPEAQKDAASEPAKPGPAAIPPAAPRPAPPNLPSLPPPAPRDSRAS
jgi:hypothetical protein